MTKRNGNYLLPPTPGRSLRRSSMSGVVPGNLSVQTANRLLDLAQRGAARVIQRQWRNYRSQKASGASKFNPRGIKFFNGIGFKTGKKKPQMKFYSRPVPGNTAGGDLRKKWSKAPSKNLFRHGCTLQREVGNVVTDSDCVYIGHGIPTQELHSMVWRAILKQLFEQAGIQIQSFDKDVVIDSADTATTHTLRLSYYKDVEAQTWISIVISPIAAGSTITNIATQLITAVSANFTTNLADGDKPKFTHLRYIQTNTARPTENEYIAGIYLEHYNVVVDHKSHLKFQNITPAGNAAALDEDRYNAQNVESVTLTGKAYKRDQWANCFEITRKTTGAGSSSGLLANQLTGIIVNTYAGLQVSGEETFSKPPPAWMLGCKKQEKVTVNPGKIFRDTILFSTKISLNKLMGLICDLVKTNDYGKEVEFGISHVFALEKMLDMRLVGDSNITLGYEIDYTLKVNGYYKKPPAIPLVDID